MKVAFLKREYEKKIFSKGQLTQFAQRLAGFCDFPPTDLGIIIHEKSADAETSRRCALSDLMNICEIGKTMSCLAFHSDLNIIKLRFQLNSQAITITYNIKGNIENARQIVFLTEDTLELTSEGKELKDKLFPLALKAYEKAINGIDKKQIEEVKIVLNKIFNNLE